jgi:hypothetical protein
MCGAFNEPKARQCVICGAALSQKTERSSKTSSATQPAPAPQNGYYDSAQGEDDLLARNVMSTPLVGIIGFGLFVVITALIIGAIVFFGREDGDDNEVETVQNQEQATLAETLILTSPMPSNTPPDLPSAPLFPTITPLPATNTPTETPGPCIVPVEEGDTLSQLIFECGHLQSADLVPTVIELNGLDENASLSIGQEIEIPRPTPTSARRDTDEDAGASLTEGENGEELDVETLAVAAEATSDNASVNEFGTPDNLATLFLEPTLRPGLMWHTISSGENIIIIAQQYEVDAKVLSDLNPEVNFNQCDFSAKYGGPNCIVILVPGQRMRVPAPLPTPTLSPTPSGSETATPTLTPTFNMPEAFSPADGAYFGADRLVTLRWSATGTLAANERYLVRVTNLDTDEDFRARTDELFFVMPQSWQPDAGQTSEFEWTVEIEVVLDNAVVETRQPTHPRRFRWEG